MHLPPLSSAAPGGAADVPRARHGEVVHTLLGETMGTRWRVCLVAAPHAPLPLLHACVQQRLDKVVAQMSTWREDSDIVRYGRASPDTWHALSDDVGTVLRCALEVSRRSDGAFDPTVGPALRLWGFGAHAEPARIPGACTLQAVREHVGWQRLRLCERGTQLHQPGGVTLDFSAIAKGFAVDAVAAALHARGIEAMLVDVGGELLGRGRKPDGSAWCVLVECGDDDADTQALPTCVLTLDDAAIASSGDRWHHFNVDGRRYSHTIDPRTLAPVADAPAYVSVITDSAMRADAWATALTVMGATQAHAFAEAQGMAARIVSAPTVAGAAPVVTMTAAFAARLV